MIIKTRLVGVGSDWEGAQASFWVLMTFYSLTGWWLYGMSILGRLDNGYLKCVHFTMTKLK